MVQYIVFSVTQCKHVGTQFYQLSLLAESIIWIYPIFRYYPKPQNVIRNYCPYGHLFPVCNCFEELNTRDHTIA